MARTFQHRLIKPIPGSRASARGGYTLVEVVVAILLTSVMVTSIFSVALTVKTGGNKGDRKIRATAGARLITTQLRNYVTGDPLTVLVPGPNASNGANRWSINGAPGYNGVGIIDSQGNAYALAPNSHTLTNVLPATFEAAPFNARVIYFVTTTDTITDGVNTRPIPSVSVTTTWTDP